MTASGDKSKRKKRREKGGRGRESSREEEVEDETLKAKSIKSSNGIPTMGNGKMLLLFRLIIYY